MKDGWILDFDDGKAERISIQPTMRVEHFDPKSSLVNGGKPALEGMGTRAND